MFMYSPQNIKFKQRPKQATVNSGKGRTNTTLTQQTNHNPGPHPTPTTHLPCDSEQIIEPSVYYADNFVNY